MRGGILLTMLGLIACDARAKEPAMIDRARLLDAVKEAAVADHGWKPEDIEVGALRNLEFDGCLFYRATHMAWPGSHLAEYAVLPSGQIVGAGGEERSGAEIVLQACGKVAPAQWWAEVVTRLSGKVSGIVVDPIHAPAAFRAIRAAGDQCSPSKITTAADATEVTFHTMQYEMGVPYHVTAVLSNTGTLLIEQRAL